MKRFNTVLALTLILSGCQNRDGKTQKEPSIFEGIYLEASEAKELRKTGRLQSLCSEIRKDPKSRIINTRLINHYGAVYLYDPEAGVRQELVIGQATNDGQLDLLGAFKLESPSLAARLEFNTDKTELKLKMGKSGTLTYLPTTDTEVRNYFEAQKACLTDRIFSTGVARK